MISANEARALTNTEDSTFFRRLEENIKTAATLGRRSFSVPNLTAYVVTNLELLGYTISTYDFGPDDKGYIVSW